MLCLAIVFTYQLCYGVTVTSLQVDNHSNYYADTLRPVADSLSVPALDDVYQPSWKKLILPGVFVSYGVLSLVSERVKTLNYSTRYEIREHVSKRIKLDNYTQYAPAVIVYGLNAAGVYGRHRFKERSLIYLSSQLMVAGMVLPLKNWVGEIRPDSSNRRSFPSGHTATAFSSAHFMFLEYKKRSMALALSGYSFALFTGVYRALNNKHWVGDVVAGAGIGILATEMSYWLFPKVKQWLHIDKNKNAPAVYPVAGTGTIGIGLLHFF